MDMDIKTLARAASMACFTFSLSLVLHSYFTRRRRRKNPNPNNRPTISTIPDELLADILSRLPVKSLLRFRCVSKQWCALIGSQHFIDLHLTRSTQSNINSNIIISSPSIRFDSCLYSISLDSLDKAVRPNHPPLNLNATQRTIVGSCNGLLCLTDTENYIFLWNPSTRKYRKSPISRIPLGGVEFVVFGFGYDDVRNDYKVVRMVQFYGKDKNLKNTEVSVYALKSDSWRGIGDFPYYFTYNWVSGVFASGALHWVVSQNHGEELKNLIAAFDLRTEEYSLVPQPKYSEKNFRMNVDILGGCLCVICNYYKSHVDMWVMKDYGVEKSWTKLISITRPTSLNVIPSYDVLLPVAYSNSHKQVLLLEDYAKFIWYDLTTERVMDVEIDGMPYPFDSRVCLESLVQLRGGVESAGRSG